MGHQHDHGPTAYGQTFAIGITLNMVFVAVEAVFGIKAASLALLADAGHNLSDVLGLALAWGAYTLSQKKATERHTYGWRRSSILAALLNAILLLVAIGGITWEAIQRFGEPTPVAGGTVIYVAIVGIIINAATAFLFMAGGKNDLNIRGAFLHMAADAGVSAGVVIAGVTILYTGWEWLDPVVSLLISCVILIGTWGLLRESLNLALDAVPEGIDIQAVESYLKTLPGVLEVHHLHIWAMSTTESALTVHLVKPDTLDDDELLEQVSKGLHDRFDIEHTTIQWERNNLCSGVCGDDND